MKRARQKLTHMWMFISEIHLLPFKINNYKQIKFKTLFWIGLSVILLFSCEKRTDTTIVEIESELIADIPITSAILEDSQLKSSSSINYSFTGSCTFCLKHNDDLKNCQNNISALNPVAVLFYRLRLVLLYFNWGEIERR